MVDTVLDFRKRSLLCLRVVRKNGLSGYSLMLRQMRVTTGGKKRGRKRAISSGEGVPKTFVIDKLHAVGTIVKNQRRRKHAFTDGAGALY